VLAVCSGAVREVKSARIPSPLSTTPPLEDYLRIPSPLSITPPLEDYLHILQTLCRLTSAGIHHPPSRSTTRRVRTENQVLWRGIISLGG